MLRPKILMGLLMVLPVVACSDDGGYDVDDVASDLRVASGDTLSEDQAHCVATELIEEFGEEDFQRVFDAAQNLTEGDGNGEVRTRIIDIYSGCDALRSLIDDAPAVDDGSIDGDDEDGS